MEAARGTKIICILHFSSVRVPSKLFIFLPKPCLVLARVHTSAHACPGAYFPKVSLGPATPYHCTLPQSINPKNPLSMQSCGFLNLAADKDAVERNFLIFFQTWATD
jgi:hypothetical protein